MTINIPGQKLFNVMKNYCIKNVLSLSVLELYQLANLQHLFLFSERQLRSLLSMLFLDINIFDEQKKFYHRSRKDMRI